MYPSQRKYLLSTLGVVDPQDNQMIIFHVNMSDNPPLPSFVAFQIPVSIRNATVQRCIIYKGASTYEMADSVWKQFGSPNLSPPTITLHVLNGHPS